MPDNPQKPKCSLPFAKKLFNAFPGLEKFAEIHERNQFYSDFDLKHYGPQGLFVKVPQQVGLREQRTLSDDSGKKSLQWWRFRKDEPGAVRSEVDGKKAEKSNIPPGEQRFLLIMAGVDWVTVEFGDFSIHFDGAMHGSVDGAFEAALEFIGDFLTEKIIVAIEMIGKNPVLSSYLKPNDPYEVKEGNKVLFRSWEGTYDRDE